MSAAEFLDITRFESLTKPAGTVVPTTWSELRHMLGTPEPRPEDPTRPHLAGWSPATFRDGQRAKDRVLEVTALSLDFDEGGPSLDDIRVGLSGLQAYVHNTRRSRPTAPRWRATVAVSRVMTADEHAIVWRWMRQRLAAAGLVVDEQTKDASRFWFVPCEPAEGDFVFAELDGEALDVDAIVAESAQLPIAPATKSTAADETPEPRTLERERPRAVNESEPADVARISMATRRRRASAYVECAEVAVSGDNGHKTAMRVATAVVRGFALDEATALEVLGSWNARCEPPWSSSELAHKVREASRVGAVAWGAKLLEGRDENVRDASDANGREPSAVRAMPPRVDAMLGLAIERAERRCAGVEKPIALPWPVLAPHFGGGLWPGLHVVNKGTGIGGTQLALQVAAYAAKRGVPGLYVGLELGQLDLALRLLGEEAHVPWSHLWTGSAGPAHVERARAAVPKLEGLPIHCTVAPPHGFAPSALLACVEAMRAAYPEENGPGSRPLLVVVDFLQLIGDEPEKDQDLRVRVGRASYALRDLANRLNVTVLCISSVARDRYKLLSDIVAAAELAWDLDGNGCPVNRRILNTDAIVGSGKESGEVEYSADSVSVLARASETWTGHGIDVVFATAKGRATGATWSPLHFTGHRYEECEDRGGRMVEAWTEAKAARERQREEKRTAKEAAAQAQIETDAEAIRAYVAAHPGCSVRDARVNAVADQPRRWAPAVARLGGKLVSETVGRSRRLRVAAPPSPKLFDPSIPGGGLCDG